MIQHMDCVHPSTFAHSENKSCVSNMRVYLIFVICLVLPEKTKQEADRYLKFPDGFTLGAGGSAYQIEGGWNASGKGESVWDRFTHAPSSKIKDRSNGDIACDAYHKYKEDVRLMKEMGLDHYRFSIGWSRVLPNGFPSSFNQEGLQYYHNLIDELLANGIEPLVQMYHWDHPQVLEDMGGWLNESMVEWFTGYADIIFRELGPKVKVFTTINEPKVFCALSYFRGFHAPGKSLNRSAEYLCMHNALKAHATAYHLYNEKYRPTQNGKIGIVEDCGSYYPKNPNETLPAEIAARFSCDRTFHPIFIGDYSGIVKTKYAEVNRAAGLPESNLEFSPEWIEYIRGTSDYLGLNHYASYLAEFGPHDDTGTFEFVPDVGVTISQDPSWERASRVGPFLPQSFGRLLRQMKNEYNNPPVYIMENGMTTEKGLLNDHLRIRYHHSYLKELLLAVHRDGCNVQKYTVWSWMDTFEWDAGYSDNANSFGLIYVNFSHPDRERSPKLSATWLRNVTRIRQLQPSILGSKHSAVDLQ